MLLFFLWEAGHAIAIDSIICEYHNPLEYSRGLVPSTWRFEATCLCREPILPGLHPPAFST